MTDIGHSDLADPTDVHLLALSDQSVTPSVLRDVEAFLLGLLEDGHVLGGPVRSGPTGPTAVLEGADQEAGGILLRDEEHTPLAALTDATPHGDTALRGRLVPVRRRESGHRAELALDRGDLAAAAHGPATLIVLDRPPTQADDAALSQVLSAGAGVVWVVVADTPSNPLPLPTLVAAVEAWMATTGATAASLRLRTAPLAWRDAASDRMIVERLATAIGAQSTCWLRSDDASPGALQWQSVLAELRAGTTDRPGHLDHDVARVLLRWLPPRGRRGVTLMFTGLSGSGKSTVARAVTEWLRTHTDRSVTLLDGDVVRQVLSSGLGFDRAGRVANVRRIGYVAAEVTRHGGIAVCAPIAPYAQTRAEVRAMVEAVGDFLLIHVNTPIEECERRDLKGLYARARAGTLPQFTGVSDPYDAPDDAVASIDTSVVDTDTAVDVVISLLRDGGWLEGRAT